MNLNSIINMQFERERGPFSPFGRDAEGREGIQLCNYHLTLSLSSRRGENKSLILNCLIKNINRTQVMKLLRIFKVRIDLKLVRLSYLKSHISNLIP